MSSFTAVEIREWLVDAQHDTGRLDLSHEVHGTCNQYIVVLQERIQRLMSYAGLEMQNKLAKRARSTPGGTLWV